MRSRQSSHARTRSRPRVWLAALTTLTALAVSAPASTAERQSSPARPWATAGIVREWNAIAGQAAIDACLAPANNPLHESRMYAADAHRHPRRAQCHRPPFRAHMPSRHPARCAARPPTPRWRPPRQTCLVALIGELPEPFAGCAGREHRRRGDGLRGRHCGSIPAGDVQGPGGAGSDDAAAATDPAPTGPATASTPSCSTPTLRRAPIPGSTGSHPTASRPSRPSCSTPLPLRRSPRDGPTSPRSRLKDGTAVPSRQAVPGHEQRGTPGDLDEVKRLGGDGHQHRARTADQTEIALFWFESSPLHVEPDRAATSPTASGLDGWESARLFGLLNMALADGYIGSFETKYHYYTWRPVTAIRDGRHRRQPGHRRRSDVDAARRDAYRSRPTTPAHSRRGRRPPRRC